RLGQEVRSKGQLIAMEPFVYTAKPARVVFGADVWSTLKAEAGLLGGRRVLALCTPRQRMLAQQISETLGPDAAGIYDQAAMHVPAATVHDALAVVRDLQVDCMVAIGGGST